MRNLFVVVAKQNTNFLVLGVFKDRNDGLDFIQSSITDQINEHIRMFPKATPDELAGIKHLIQSNMFVETARYYTNQPTYNY